MSERQYPIGGYAPGGYMNHCSNCKKEYLGDKRSWECEDCAIKNEAAFNALSPEEQSELVKRNIEVYNKFMNERKQLP
jgi:hypothetical protein